LRAAAGVAAGMEEPWVPPLEANRLNHGQRSALEAFIRATVQSQPDGSSEADNARTGPDRQQILAYIAQLREIGQTELADRLADSLESTSSASETARRSSSS